MAYTFKVGARGEGAVSALLDLVQRRQTQREEEETEFRKFRQHMTELGVRGMIPGIEPSEEFMAAMISGGPFQGQAFRRTSPPDLSARPGETISYRDRQGVTRTVRGQGITDPSMEASRMAATLKNLQDIEAFNEAQRERARPASRGFFGIGARPAVPAGPTVDTSELRRRLQQAQGITPGSLQLGGETSYAAPDMNNEVGDLIAGVQEGLIQTRRQAEAVILQAGLDPNDPAFAAVLNQLP